MNHRQEISKFGIILTGALALLFTVSHLLPESPLSGDLDEAISPIASSATVDPISVPSLAPEPVVSFAQSSASDTGWINNGGRLTPGTAQLLSWVEAGYPVDVRLGTESVQRYGFRSLDITSESFQISSGTNSRMDAEFRIFSGRQLNSAGQLGEEASLAIVNGAVSMALTVDGRNYLVETDPVTGDLYATDLQAFDIGHSCASGACESDHVQCQISPDGLMAAASAPAGIENSARARLPISLIYPGDRIDAAGLIEQAGEPDFEAATAGKPYMRNGSQYDASLKDIPVLMVSSKSQSGPTSGLSAKAANYFAYAARTADVYERQLGLRYLLQELVLVPSDSSEADPGNPSGTTLGDDLYHLRTWITSNRPQSTYKWGHVALWTLVDGGGGGVVGLAWTDSYGEASYGHSVQEPNWGWEVHSHELGHNVGSSHSSGGVMNPSLQTGNENFFTFVQSQSYTSAKDIYNHISSPTKPYVLGNALLRHPEEIPFGVDDSISTSIGSPVSFNPLSNDLTQAPNGAANILTLIEVGQVLPKAAGSAKVVNGQILFTPASGFTGEAWFAYTLGGNVGNGGEGWLHRADVVITVGGNSTAPSTSPALSLTTDTIVGELTGPVRINPLLNDEGTGRLWSGDVEAMIGPNDTTPENYSEGALSLVDAAIITGTGTLTLETRNMVRSGSSATDYSGYLTYTPGANEGGEVVIEYTASDADGNIGTAQIIIAEAATVGVTANVSSISEDSGDIITLTFLRSGAADTSIDEWIDFIVTGTADSAANPADFALAGHSTFDPVSRIGSIVIPAGESQAFIYIAVDDDGTNEGQESIGLAITNTSSLLLSSSSALAEVFITDNSLVYAESFDGFGADSTTWSGWTNFKDKRANGKGGEDWFDWAIDSFSTPTAGTGPSGDHTLGSGKYLFAEATGNTDVFSILQSPVIGVSGVGGADLEFWYHMYGSGVGSLSLDLYADGSLVAASVWSASGQQSANGSDWKKASIDISAHLPAQNIQLLFRVDTTSSDLGDIAIDDIQILAGSIAPPQAPNILVDPSGCSVQTGESVYLSVIAEGYPAPSIQWLKDGVPIPGATSSSFYISSASSSSAGTYTALVLNSEGSISSLSAAVSLPPNLEYFTWVTDNGLAPEDSVEDADPDFDGVINLFEFAFDLSPISPSSSDDLPTSSIQQDSGSTYLQISYRRRTGGVGTSGVNYSVDGLTYMVETSTSLGPGSWLSGAEVVQAVGSPVVNGDGTETVTVRCLTPIDSGCAFIRLSVVLN